MGVERQRHEFQADDLLRQLRDSGINIARKETHIDELTAELRRQLQATKKLTWFLKEVEKAASRLRSSRRWKLANPFAALREALGGRLVSGYGHLEKIVSEYAKWRAIHPEAEATEEHLQATGEDAVTLDFKMNERPSPSFEPPEPTEAIAFPMRDVVEVSLIIPVFNQMRFTEACLASIQKHQDNTSVEVLVIDDCSTDSTEERLREIPGLVYLRNEINVGFIASCNRGATQARGRYLVFLNNDALVTAGWLAALLETFQFEPEAGLVGSKLVYPDGRLQEAGGIIWRDGSGWNRGKFDDARKPEYNYLRETDYCSGACIAINKSLFESLGGFDSRYAPAYYEDTDLAFKVRAAGLKVYYQPLSEIIHFEGATGGNELASGTKKYQNINRSAFASKWAEALAAKPVNGDFETLEQLDRARSHILVIDHHLPMPDRDSGSLRMFQILLILHQLGHRVTFIADNFGDIPPYTTDLRRRGIEVPLRPHLKSARDYLQRHGAKLDAVILSRCATAKKHIDDVRLHASAARVIFDTVDLHFLRCGRQADLTMNTQQRMVALDTRQQEYELIRQADETWVVSEAERELLLRDLPEASIEVVSNIVETRDPTTRFSQRSDFLFIGSFLHPPNIDAVLFFTKEVYPLILQQLPDVRFYVIGHKAPAEIMALVDGHVIVTGPVADVRPFFDSVKLSIAPLRFGAGVKGKINQSMGLGVPVVGTSLAVEGMSLTHGENVLVADEPAEFAHAVVDLYRSEEIWNRLSKNGLENTRLLFSADTARTQLSRLFSDEHRLGTSKENETAPAVRPVA